MSDKSAKKWDYWQEILTTCKSPSKASIPWDQLGIKRTEGKDYDGFETMLAFYIVLDRAQRNPFRIKGRFAREGALHVAICASEGLITVKVDDVVWTNKWSITPEGISLKEKLYDLLEEHCGEYESTDTIH